LVRLGLGAARRPRADLTEPHPSAESAGFNRGIAVRLLPEDAHSLMRCSASLPLAHSSYEPAET
jgi:hypothetical protein